MALEDTTNKQSFTAVAGETQFVFNLPFFDASTIDTANKKYGDIKVTREAAGVITQFTPKETFTVPAVDGEFKIIATNNDPEQGGRVTISVAASGGEKFIVERDVAYSQQYDLQEGSTIDPTALNKALDRVVAQNQQQNDAFTRTIEFPVTDSPSTTYTVDSTTNRANKALGFDASGNVTEINLIDSGQISGDTSAGISITDNIIRAKVDNSTTQFSGGNIAVKTVGTSQIADGSVTSSKLGSDVDITKLQNNVIVRVTQGSGGGNSPSDTTVVMTGGISKTFSASNYNNNAASTINAAINEIPKDLNGYTVNFKFGLESSSSTHRVTVEDVLTFYYFSNGQFMIESANLNDYASTSTNDKKNRLQTSGTNIHRLMSIKDCQNVTVRGLHLEQSTGTTNYKEVVLVQSSNYVVFSRCNIEGITNAPADANTPNGGTQRGVVFASSARGSLTHSFVNNVYFGLDCRDGSHVYALDCNDLGTSSSPVIGNRAGSGIIQPRGTVIGGSTGEFQVVYNGLVVNSGGTILT